MPAADHEQPAAGADQAAADPGATPGEPAAGSTAKPSADPANFRTLEEGLRRLPPYAQSLLKIKVPVKVTLATAKQPIDKILRLGPGSIIQFKKSCDDTLVLEVGQQEVAQGEAVKVGDKFGLWITAMTLPEERFWAVHPKAGNVRVK